MSKSSGDRKPGERGLGITKAVMAASEDVAVVAPDPTERQRELATLMKERAALSERINRLRDEIAREAAPFEPGDVLRKKGDRTDWIVLRVRRAQSFGPAGSPMAPPAPRPGERAAYLVEMTTLSRAGVVGNGEVTRSPQEMTAFKKKRHVDLSTLSK